MNSILNTYAKQTGVINRTITEKYKDIIEEARWYMSTGSDKTEAVEMAIKEFSWKFESEEDKALLLSWFNGSFGKFAA